jgi:hypothetical protein
MTEKLPCSQLKIKNRNKVLRILLTARKLLTKEDSVSKKNNMSRPQRRKEIFTTEKVQKIEFTS